MIQREMETRLRVLAQQYPAVSISGARQSGKTTLARAVFPDYTYLSFENPDVRDAFIDDPNTFLQRYRANVIFDEAQRVPELFSYLQSIIDEQHQPGRFVITGSQNFLLMKSISQSLAGRIALFTLPPLSLQELTNASLMPEDLATWLFRGGYPRLYNGILESRDFFADYVQTYLERDVRSELGVRAISAFRTFLELCALRCGELLNVSSLASDSGIAVGTAREWLSILEASGIIFLLRPYAVNRGKRLVKSPKLYFVDTGLASYLMGLDTPSEIHDMGRLGQLFETGVVSEVLKRFHAQKRTPRLSFWRDDHKQEIDLIIEKGANIARAIECKSSTTYRSKYFDVLERIARSALELPVERRAVVYGGTLSLHTERGEVIPYTEIGTLLA